MTKENMRKKWEEQGMDIDRDCLCSDCECVKSSLPEYHCSYAWDLYNFGDGCLGDK